MKITEQLDNRASDCVPYHETDKNYRFNLLLQVLKHFLRRQKNFFQFPH